MSDYRVRARHDVFHGHVLTLHTDEVEMPDGKVAVREVVDHPGAVAVVALDDEGRVVVVRQFRHPVREQLIELPAGLLDVAGEPAWQAAARELGEEARLRADTWHVLADFYSSPGMSSEAIRVFLAEGLHEHDSGFEPEHEEIAMTTDRVALADLLTMISTGELANATILIGVLAAARAVADRGVLRPADSPWPARPGH